MNAEEDQKIVKTSLNETLSAAVKFLQTEAKRGDSLIQSDSKGVQQFLSVLEAAFIHGLKKNFYEKQKTNKELPKPQFWTLLCEISHKNTLEQIRKLAFIRTKVGRCRAWLRLALNDMSLSSYLTVLLRSPEYCKLVEQHYDDDALFRDNEQRDIFMTYLQGTENLLFELGCNSAILNAWTRTPLELSTIIRTNTAKMHLTSRLTASKQISSPSRSLKEASSFDSLSSSLYNRDDIFSSLVKDSLQNSYESSISRISGNLPDGSPRPPLEVDGIVAANDELHAEQDQSNLLTAVVKRHVHRRKKKSKHFKEDGRLSPGSRCSSSSSVNTSQVDNCVEAPVSLEINRSRTSSFDSPKEPPSINIIGTDGAQSSISLSNEEDIREASDANIIPASHIIQETLQLEVSSVSSSTTEYEINSISGTSNIDSDSGSSELSDQKAAEFRLGTTDGSSHTQSTSVENLSHSAPDSCVPKVTSNAEDLIDIYAIQSLPHSLTITDVVSTTDSSARMSSTSGSPGYGNSLLCGIGWSSEIDEESLSSPHQVIQSPTSTDIKRPVTNEDSELVIRRGLLQKKGETFRFWRTRWFVLTTTSLSFYRDQKHAEELGIILLSDVKHVDDTDVEKKKILSLSLMDGDEQQLAAESSDQLLEWAADIRRAVELQRSPDDSQFNALETTYVVVHSNDIERNNEDAVGPDLSNTSWRSAMRHHITRIAMEKGLDMQNYQCADCAAPIGILYGVPRVCYFTGQYYCSQCHLNDEYRIPARMIHNWDFKKHKVSKRSKEFLSEIWNDPCIDLSRVNPIVYNHIDVLQNLLPLRLKLSALYPYVNTCRKISLKDLVSILRSRYYMMENPHLYSAHDLYKTKGKSLYEKINKAVSFAIQHVTTCELCLNKGHLCEVCNKSEVIFAFQTETTLQCEDCKSVYHKACLSDMSMCRKCARRHRRLQEAAENHDENLDSGSESS